MLYSIEHKNSRNENYKIKGIILRIYVSIGFVDTSARLSINPEQTKSKD